MGVDYWAIGAVGCKIKLDKLMVPCEPHEHKNPKGAKFCSICGKSLESKVVLPDEEGLEEQFSPLKVIMGSTDDWKDVILAAAAQRVGDYAVVTRFDIGDIEQHKAKVKSVLEPRGLWDEKDFGVWVVLDCSY